MTLTTKKVLAVFASLVFIAAAIFILQTNLVKGAIAVFSPNTCYTASATSTPTILTIGATSTLPCFVGVEGARQATLLVTYAASTSVNTNLQIALEYSMDGIDYFSDNLGIVATTTPGIPLTVSNSYNMKFASSSVGGQLPTFSPPCFVGQQKGDCMDKAINIPTPTKYIRAIFTSSGGTAAVWAQIIPRVDIN